MKKLSGKTESGNRKKSGRHSPAVWAIVAAGLVLLVVLTNILARMARSVDTSETTKTTYSEQVTTGDIAAVLPGSGTLEDDDSVTIEIPDEVEITKWYVSSGDSVSEGDALARVDDDTVLSAMAAVQEKIDAIDEAIEEHADDEGEDTLTSSADARVKAVYAAEGDEVIDVMYENGALMLLSLDGLMAVDIETDTQLSAGDEMTVTLPDGSTQTGTVESMTDGTAVVTISDKYGNSGDEVSVSDADGAELGTGTLYIHSELKLTAFSGSVDDIKVSDEEKVDGGDTLLTLDDVENKGVYELLLAKRAELSEDMQLLAKIHTDGYISASSDGVVAELAETDENKADEDESADDDTTAENESTGDAGSTGISATESSYTSFALQATEMSYTETTVRVISLSSAGEGGNGDGGASGDGSGNGDGSGDAGSTTYYTIAAGEADGGTIKVKSDMTNTNGLVGGEKITVTLRAYSDYKVSGIVITDADDKELEIETTKDAASTDAKAIYTFEMPSQNIKVTPVFEEEKDDGTQTPGAQDGNGSGSTDGSGTGSGGASGNEGDAGNAGDAGSAGSSGSLGSAVTGSVSGGTYSLGSSSTGTYSTGTDTASEETTLTSETIDQTYGVEKTTALSITPQEYVYITITVDELDILEAQVGYEAQITLDAFPGQSFTGVVESIDYTGTNAGGNSKYTAKLRMERTQDMLSGMNASAKITISTKEGVLTIPEAAIVEDESGTHVYTGYDEKTGELTGLTDIETGVSDGENVEVVSGLSEGDTYWYEALDTVNYASGTSAPETPL